MENQILLKDLEELKQLKELNATIDRVLKDLQTFAELAKAVKRL